MSEVTEAIEVQMEKTKETKRMVRYDCVRDDVPVNNIYIMKSDLPDEHPKQVTVTVTF